MQLNAPLHPYRNSIARNPSLRYRYLALLSINLLPSPDIKIVAGMSFATAVFRGGIGLLLAGSVTRPSLPPCAAQASLELKWVRSVWEGEEHIPLSIDVNAAGDVYLAGYSDEHTPFLALIDSEGNEEWFRRLSIEDWGAEWLLPYYREYLAGFRVATSGEQVLTIEGPTYLLDSEQPGSGGYAIVRYAADGVLSGVTPLGSIHTTWPGYITNVGIDRYGDAYVSGTFAGSLFTGEHRIFSERFFPPFEDSRPADVFVAKYASDGTLVWTRRLGGPGGDWTGDYPIYYIAGYGRPSWNRSAMAVDEDGNVFLDLYTYSGALLSGSGRNVLVSPRDRALVSLDSDGQFRWARTERDLGIPGHTVQRRLAADPYGNVVALWSHSERGYGGYNDSYLVKFSGKGEIVFMYRLNDGEGYNSELATDGRGYIYLGGTFHSNSLRLGTQVLNLHRSGYNTDGFVGWFDDAGTLRGIVHVTGAGDQHLGSLSVTPWGDLYLTGLFTEQLILDTDTLVTDERYGVFVAKYGTTITRGEEAGEVPLAVMQLANYPNPFADETSIEFWLPRRSDVRLTVYDILGRRVSLLVDQPLPRGRHEAIFHAAARSPGLYFYRLEAAGTSSLGRMHLVR